MPQSISTNTFVSDTLIHWYEANKRDLPWRETIDPYKIWISEIILQQTRVSQGLSYYLKFIYLFPDIISFANAHEDEILKTWQGLGYYSRARNMHKTAQIINNNYKGKFPDNYDDLIKLPGIGDYTASAISSIAFNQPHAVLDGNVYRFLSRYFGIENAIDSNSAKKIFKTFAANILSNESPALHNQAIMEFGALQCIPSNPDCSNCPFSETCSAYNNNMVSRLPFKERKTKITQRYFNYLFICDKNDFYLSKRTNNDIWKNLYELPLIENDHLFSEDELVTYIKQNFHSTNTPLLKNIRIIKHKLSHQLIHAKFTHIEFDALPTVKENRYTRAQLNKKDEYAISRLTELYFEIIANPENHSKL